MKITMAFRHRFFKGIAISIGIAIPIVPVIAVINYAQNEHAIFESGSSSVLPLMVSFSNSYKKSQLVPTGGGSGKGLEDVAVGNIDFGSMSSNKKDAILTNSRYTSLWKEHKNKTITVAKDAIAISLEIPSSIKIDTSKKVTDSEQKLGQKYYPVVNPVAIAKIYSTNFAGKVMWKDLLENAAPNSDQKELNSPVIGFGRTGGKSASGTSDGFFNILSKFANKAIHLDENHNSSNIIKTPESNAQAYSRLNNYKDGGITYLSLGYMTQILKKPSNNNVQIAFVNTKNILKKTWDAPTISASTNGTYGWVRPFNTAFSTNSPKYIFDFARWILSSSVAQKNIDDLFLVPLKQQEKSDQLNDIKKSDFDLYNNNHNDPYAFGLQK